MRKIAARKKPLATPSGTGGTPAACAIHPRPWRVDHFKRLVIAANGEWVLRFDEEDLETADLIVDAVNSRASGNDQVPKDDDMRTVLKCAHRLGVRFDRGGA
jgi:hypothetical protein